MAPTKRPRGSETMGKLIRKSGIRAAAYADDHYYFKSTKKNTRQVSARSSTRNTTARAKDQEQKQKPSPFLELPAELRNEIYEYDMINHESIRLSRRVARAKISATKGFPISSRSGLLKVNRQVREEYSGLAITEAPTTETEVVNFNFGHLITYFNSLEENLIKKLETSEANGAQHKPTPKAFLIHLTCNKNLNDEHMSGLKRWLNRMGNKTKQGSLIEMRYRFKTDDWTHWNFYSILVDYTRQDKTRVDASGIWNAHAEAHEKFRGGSK